MKRASEKVLPPRASRCHCPSCPSRGRVLSAQPSTIAPLCACRSWSCSARRCNCIIETMGSSSSRFYPTRLRKACKSVGHVPMPCPSVTRCMPTRSPIGHLRDLQVRVTSIWAGLSYADAQEVSGVNVLWPEAVQCLVHSTNGPLELIMVQQSQQWLTGLHYFGRKSCFPRWPFSKNRRPEILLREASSHLLCVRDLPKRTVT